MSYAADELLAERIGYDLWRITGLWPLVLERQMREERSLPPGGTITAAVIFQSLLHALAVPTDESQALGIYLETGELAAAEHLAATDGGSTRTAKQIADDSGPTTVALRRQQWESQFDQKRINAESYIRYVAASTDSESVRDAENTISEALILAAKLGRFGRAMEIIEGAETELRRLHEARRDVLNDRIEALASRLQKSPPKDATALRYALLGIERCRLLLKRAHLHLVDNGVTLVNDALAESVQSDEWESFLRGEEGGVSDAALFHAFGSVVRTTARADLVKLLEGQGQGKLRQEWSRLEMISQPDRADAAHVLRRWYELARSRADRREELLTSDLPTLVHYTGLQLVSPEGDWLGVEHWGYKGRVVPLVGSSSISLPALDSALYPDGVDLLVVWPDAPTQKVLNHVNPHTPTFLMLLGFVDDAWRTYAREQALLILDENVVKWLSAVPSPRTQATLMLTVPYASRNALDPYTAHGAVPHEMFYGRKDELDSILRPSGRRIIYGGRFVGKSSLLREACLRIHDPERGHVGVYCMVAGRPEDGTTLFHYMVESLQHTIQEAGLAALDATDLEDAVMEVLAKQSGARLFFFLDEYDEAIREDEAQGWPVGNVLRRLAETHRPRLAFVFAGFQHMHRATHQSSSPYYNLQSGELPSPLGPLKPEDALRLVEDTLGLFGCVFETRSTALRVVHYAARYPNILQTFCKHLLHQAPATGEPPYRITDGHVDKAYGDLEIRATLANAFRANLNQDDRYKAVLYGLLIQRAKSLDRGLLNAEFTVDEATSVGKEYMPNASWSLATVRELLEELGTLGVVTYRGNSHEDGTATFRIASEHFARILLAHVDVEADLLEVLERNEQTH